MKKALVVLLIIAFAATIMLAGFACAQPAAETTAAAEETTAAASGKNVADLDIVYVVKADGIPWFDTERAGMDQCASDYGFKATTVGPPTADAALQAQMIEDYLAAGVEAVGVCPNDPAAIEPVFEKAMSQGVITFAHEGSSFKNVNFDIEAMDNVLFGETIMEKGVDLTGDTGQYVWSVGWLTSVSHNIWVDSGIALQQEKYPNKVNALGYEAGSDRYEEQEDTTIAHDKMIEYLKTYPDINVLFGSPMTTLVAAGLVIEETGSIDTIGASGTGLPITIGDHIRNGINMEGFFWDPYLVGYAMGYIVMMEYLGTPLQPGDPVLLPDGTPLKRYEEIGMVTNDVGGTVIFGQGLENLNKDNLEEWDAQFKEYGF